MEYNFEKVWLPKKYNPLLREELAQDLGVSLYLSQILLNRGIDNTETAKDFLNPSLNNLKDPFILPDIETAIKRIKQAITSREKVLIYGDYDVDGITSSVMLFDYLSKRGCSTEIYIPSRAEGYGLNKSIIKKKSKEGFSLLITADCGIGNFAEIKIAQELKIDVIVTDHHLPGPKLPEAYALVNPKLKSEPNGLDLIAGAGVAFKLIQALEGGKVPEQYLDLVTLGTVADIVTLQGENRHIVANGLEYIVKSARPGLGALLEVSGLTGEPVTAGKIGFWIAPRLNASGRIDNPSDSINLLLAKTFDEAMPLARKLDEKNRARQKEEAITLEKAMQKVEAEVDLGSDNAILLYDSEWKPGIVGIVASRLVEKYCRPAILFSKKGKILSGSGRSIKTFHLLNALEKLRPILIKFGGHHHAAGLSLSEERFEEFRRQFLGITSEEITDQDLKPKIEVDLILNQSELTDELVEEVSLLSPFGMGNPRPVMAINNAGYFNVKTLSNGKHLRFDIPVVNNNFEAIGFHYGDRASLLNKKKNTLDLAFHVERNTYKGNEKIQLKLIDLKLEKQQRASNDFIESLFNKADIYLSDDEYKHIGECSSFYTKVAGVSFEGRQDTIEGLQPGAEVSLIREPDNEYDSNAIKVINLLNNYQIGFLNKKLAKYMAILLDEGIVYKASVSDVTGGEDKHRGVNLLIERADLISSMKGLNIKDDKWKNMSYQESLNELERYFLPDGRFHSKQKEAIDVVRDGKNTLLVMGTGRGKSIVFHVQAALKTLRENKLSIFVYPLRALVNDQYDYLSSKLSGLGMNTRLLTGDLSPEEKEETFNMIKKRGVDIILTTPEFFYHYQDKFSSVNSSIGFVVVDEAHHINLASQAHRPLYGKINEVIESLSSPLTMATTATASAETAKIIFEKLKIECGVYDATVRNNLKIIDKRNINSKENYLKLILQQGGKNIIYMNSREKSVELAKFLKNEVYSGYDEIAFYHSGLSRNDRLKLEEMFKNSEIKTIVATSAFGEGVNIPDIRNVFLYHLPFSYISYNQMSGRSGRDGQTAYIHLLFGKDDKKINKYILESISPSRDTLAIIYKSLQMFCDDKGAIKASTEELRNFISEYNAGKFNDKTLNNGLKILAEAGLLEIQGRGEHRQVTMNPKPEQNIDLNISVRYSEGEKEKEQFNDFANWVFRAKVNELLEAFNRPILPV